jgi:hypothetical protein
VEIESVSLSPHAGDQAQERDATREQVVETILLGDEVPAHSERIGRTRLFPYGRQHSGTVYPEIRVIAYAAVDGTHAEVVTVITKFGRWSTP